MLNKKILITFVGLGVISWGTLWYTSSDSFVKDDVNVLNRLYSYSDADLEKACDAMSPFSYVSGLTDGAFISVPFTGKTYYYQSSCYMELARRTHRADVCDKVKQRGFFGSGRVTSETACREMIALEETTAREGAAQAESHRSVIEGAVKITKTTVLPISKESWKVEVETVGELMGEYSFKIESLNQKKVLTREKTVLKEGAKSFSWVITRASLMDPLISTPAIFPIAISLTYSIPKNADYPGGEYLTSVGNATISVE